MLLSRKMKFFALALVIGIKAASSPAFAQAQGGTQTGMGQQFSFFLPLLIVFGIFYFLILRPQQKQAKKHAEMLKAVTKGDQVVTTGGIHGKIVGVADNILTLEIADNIKIKIERSGIQGLKSTEKGEAAKS